MASENTLQNYPSLPPNYVSLAQLEEQWNRRKQKQQQQQEAAAKKVELDIQKHQEFEADKQNQHYYQHQKQGDYAKNYKNTDKFNVGSKNNSNIEKSNLGSVPNYDQPSRQFQQGQKQGNYAKNCRNMEKLNVGSVQEDSDKRNIQFQQNQKQRGYDNRKKEKLNLGSAQEFDKYNGQYHQDKEQGDYVKNNRSIKELDFGGIQYSDQQDIGYVKCNIHKEKLNLVRVEGFGGNGYEQTKCYDRINAKGVYKDKGKGKIEEVGKRQSDGEFRRYCGGSDFERWDGEFRGDCGGGGVEFAVAMYVCEETLNDDEIVEAKKPEDGLRGGLTGSGSNLRAHSDVSKNLGKRNTMVETEECLERGKKVNDEAMKVGHRKKGWSRASQRNQGFPVKNFGVSGSIGKGEGVAETEEVSERKENENISDIGVAADVKNEEQRHDRGYKNGRSKKSVSEGKRGNGRGMVEENGVHLGLKKQNGEDGGEENIGGGESVAEKVVPLKELKHESVGRKNINWRVKERTRRGDVIWTVKGVEKGANVVKNAFGEKSSNNEPVEEIPVVESEIIAKADLYSNGLQINYCDNMVNNDCCKKTTEKIEIQKQELSGEEAGVKGLLMTREANGESHRGKDKNRGIWNKRGFSREKITRSFAELSLNIQRVGNGRKTVRYHQNRRFQDSQFGSQQRNNGLVWVRKEEIAGAPASNSLP